MKTTIDTAIDALTHAIPINRHHSEFGYTHHQSAIDLLKGFFDEHKELANRLRDIAVRYPEDGYLMHVCNSAADKLEGK